MQDWEWEVADVARFDEFLNAYRSQLSDDELFSLMEMLVQCVEDMVSPLKREVAWASISPLLALSASLHRSTIEYWACLGELEPEAQFNVSADMRRTRDDSLPSPVLVRSPTTRHQTLV